MRRNIIGLLFFVAMIVLSTGCVIYHKPEFKGQIIDTKQPIEEAVVVAVYNKRTMGLGAGTLSSIINVQEALTDKRGQFSIPSYTTIINPFSWAIDTSFIIFKPGYASLEMGLENEFTGKGTEVREVRSSRNMNAKFRITGSGVIEIPKLKTREERLKAMPSIVGEASDYKKQRELIRLLNTERRELWLHGEY
jgi:hypothetical protein